jgi:hypothetical protein
MEEEIEYRVPAKLLNSRDPIILGKVSLGEAGQWIVFLVLVYVSFNMLPLDGTFRLVIAFSIFMAGVAFIHSPINGLAGIEWAFIYTRFNLEKKLHRTLPPLEALTARTLISIKATGPTLRPFAWDEPELDSELSHTFAFDTETSLLTESAANIQRASTTKIALNEKE